MNPAISRPWLVFGLSAAALAVLVWFLPRQPNAGRGGIVAEPLEVYCAAGLRVPVEVVAREYERECGVPVRLHYGGSQTLLTSLGVARGGDLYLPGDESYLALAREKGWVMETLPLARMTAVLAVRKGNPKGVQSLTNLGPEIKVGQANPEAAAVGKLARQALEQAGQWAALQPRVVVSKPTVNEVANDLKLGVIDAGIVWDATVRQYPELETVPAPVLNTAQAHVAVGVLKWCRRPAAALKFARFLAASDRGRNEFVRYGFEGMEGDPWSPHPELVFYSGAMNRVAVDETVNRFERREGVQVTRVYNGCGILVAQMKAGGRPDAYLTCDQSFVAPVVDLFPRPPIEISDSEIVILVPKGNPRQIQNLTSLAQPGLRVGVANAEQSTLGALTRRLLEQAGILAAVMTNVVTQTPTADLLVNQMSTGALDATVVYVSNTMRVRERLDVVRLNVPGSVAVQTFSVGQGCRYKQLAGRLLQAIQSAESRARYEAAGFHWRGEERAGG